jgi:hypothetical protein
MESESMLRLLIFASVAVWLAGCANTPSAPAAAPPASQSGPTIYIPKDANADKPGMMLVDVFGRMCLKRFPDRDVTEGELAPVQELGPAEVRRYLHADPGRAWRLDADGGLYIVTVEAPPFNSCAVRRTYPMPVQTSLGFHLLTQAWAVNEHLGPMQFAPPARMMRNGLVIDAQIIGTPASPGHPRQTFMNITTHNPDGSTESRLVRQILPPGH